ncbi:MAG: thermonuclease family protein [Patescibacteria group bacterium]|nr:thermonuclease family protein [bacterium]MDZ4227415.1 thermonuclease family protein [Patescibacteria group bacterium]
MKSPSLWYACAGVCGVLALGAVGMGAYGGAWAAVPTGTESGPATTTAATATPTTNVAPAPDIYHVEKVVDGDTIDVLIHGESVRLRLVGMDTPEVVDPRKVVQCFGKEASAEGHRLLEEQWVRLEYDSVSGTYDKYGRTLAYVFRESDGLFYNEYMIARGFAHEYTYGGQRYKYRDDFKAAQKAAEEQRLGFWSLDACDGNTTKAAST